MANTDEPEVKIIDRVEVAPAGGDEELVEEEKETPIDSSQEKNDEPAEKESEEEDEAESEEEAPAEETPEPEPKNAAIPDDAGKKYADLERVPGETPREWALRLENAKLRDEMCGKQTQEIMQAPPKLAKKELSPEKQKVLAKYKKEDLDTLKEVFDVMAEDMGFVRQGELGATRYQEIQTEQLDNFLEKHPEYQAKNDPGGVLWKAFGEEFRSGLYNTQPANPKALAKILDKVHKEVFGIKPAAALNKQEAAKEKVKVASHSGSSRPQREGVKRANQPIQGLRTDMLKGFSDEEIAEMTEE